MMIGSHTLKTLTIAALVAVSGFSLNACSTAEKFVNVAAEPEKNPGPCPEAMALYDAARIVEFRGDESYENVGFTGEIMNVRSLCRYSGENPIDADLTMEIDFGRGPAAQGSTATYQYFVAVTRKNIEVIEKEVFPIQVTFPVGADVVSVTETVSRIIIPRANDNTSGANFEIIVGFELTPAQIAFNAAGKRFRVSAGQN